MNSLEILIADEPTSDLDIETTKEIMSLFSRINEDSGTTVLLITHELDTLEFGKKVFTMANGRIKEGTHMGKNAG